jgi:nucleotide-binding universal stress UspA family protein
MNTIKKILVATDFSSTSEEAVRSAAATAEQFDATLQIVHVLQPPNYALPEAYLTYSPQHFGETLRGLHKLLEVATTKAKAAGARRVYAKLLQGVTALEIVSFAKNEHSDLIVVGTHGRTGISHALMGSVAEKIVRTAACPVLTIRARDEAATEALTPTIEPPRNEAR